MRDPTWEQEYRHSYRAVHADADLGRWDRRTRSEAADEILKKYKAEVKAFVFNAAKRELPNQEDAGFEAALEKYSRAISRAVEGLVDHWILADTSIHDELGLICLKIYGAIGVEK